MNIIQAIFEYLDDILGRSLCYFLVLHEMILFVSKHPLKNFPDSSSTFYQCFQIVLQHFESACQFLNDGMKDGIPKVK